MSQRQDIDNVIYRFYEAVFNLAIGEGNVRARLEVVAQDLLVLNTSELPPEIRREFDIYKNQMTQITSSNEEGNITATMKRIRNPTGTSIAKLVFEMYKSLQLARGQNVN